MLSCIEVVILLFKSQWLRLALPPVVFVFQLLPLLLPESLPMIQVHFSNLNNLSIESLHGVTQISLGLTKGCFSNENGTSNCTPTSFIGLYSFVVNNGDDVQVTVQHKWIQALVDFQFAGCSLTVILGLLVSCYELIRQDLIKKTHMLISGFMLLIFLGIGILVDWLIIMHQNVRHAMQLLGTGGITSVKTSLGGGLKMNLAAIPFLGFLILLQYIICGKGREDHDSEVSQNISMTEIKNAPMSAREQRRQEEEGKKHVSDNLLEIAKNRRLASWFGVGPNS